ncbi:MAG: hypothetical protein ACREQV_18660, partial [Candidatus Binatia bacterium]
MMGKAYGFHSRALRVIGQDLAELVPKHLVMELHGADFVANGLWSRCRVEDQSLPTAWTGFKKFFDKITDTIVRVPTREPDLEFVPFSRTYNVNDIERLDEQRAICRAGASNMPDIYSLGERLRTIGKVVDGRNGRI